MMAVILAGGKGTRLKPYTMTLPKPLLPLGDKPIMEIILQQLANAGVSKIVITLGHMMHLFAPTIGDGSRWGLDIAYCLEDEPLGTAAPIRMIKDLEEDFIIMNGDLLTTLNYKSLFAEHKSRKAYGTISAHRQEVKTDYGIIKITDDDLLSEYLEKPIDYHYVSMGVYVLSRKCLDFIPELGKFDMPQLMMKMVRENKKVVCYKADCYWQDIGKFDDYQQASKDFSNHPERFLTPSK